MKKLFLGTIPIFLFFFSEAQDLKETYHPGISTGYAYSGNSFLQVGLVWGKNIGNIHSPSSAFGLGADLGFNFKNYLWAPKVFFEYNPFVALPLRLNVLNYMQSGINDVRLLPEIGLSSGGLLTISYGYAIRLSRDELPNISQSRLALNISLMKSN